FRHKDGTLDQAVDTALKHSDAPSRDGALRVLEPGRNCSGTPLARRAAVLIDGATYFGHLEEALRRAERMIFIVGWDFDAAIKLRAEADEEAPRLGDALRSLVEERPALEVRILVWSLSTVYAPGALLPLLHDTPWEQH